MFATKLNQLPDIESVEALNEDDYACIDEIREVLLRHNKIDRFGVTLLHKHFEVGDDEVLLETTDKESRVPTIRPIPAKSISEIETAGTAWSLGTMREEMKCRTECVFVDGKHRNKHVTR